MTDSERETQAAETTGEPGTPEPEDVVKTEPRQFQVSKPSSRKPATTRAATVVDGPAPYAVIATGGKQYRVKVGDRITVERLHVDAGSAITIDQVLLLGGDGSTRIGTPIVEGARVEATVDAQDRGEKIVVFKYKAKKRYRRRTGHRQEQTRLTITGISG
ncbi:MAG: LSU ribosomal protein L21p [uncultured Thermomicrobiales bacterium]|uniref:Large ribosomal subunit protein bL21 n=1 Tax=uncultured Thermomicrobiales bacterium TaxID=1645740 RepID=A0A6J4UXZ2_9BACT|nr:MAG: LSU ribosomal protein L21p [uncultured Thermomicrobiales bacterium]